MVEKAFTVDTSDSSEPTIKSEAARAIFLKVEFGRTGLATKEVALELLNI